MKDGGAAVFAENYKYSIAENDMDFSFCGKWYFYVKYMSYKTAKAAERAFYERSL